MQYVKWQALNTLDFGLFHTSVRFSERPAGFLVDHTKKGRGTSGILFVTGGSLTFIQEGLPELTVGEKALCLLPQSCHYSLRFCGKQNDQLLLNFTLISAQGEVILPGDRVELLMPTVTDPKLLHYFDMLFHQVSNGESDSALLHKEQLYRLFSLLLGEKSIDHPLQAKYSTCYNRPFCRTCQYSNLLISVTSVLVLSVLSLLSFTAFLLCVIGISYGSTTQKTC